MRKQLQHDSDTGELRLVYTDLWDGNHERTEYRVMSDRVDGRPVRNRADLDGTPVLGNVPSLYIRNPSGFGETLIWTEQVATGPTVKTPCPAAANARRKCAECSALFVQVA